MLEKTAALLLLALIAGPTQASAETGLFLDKYDHASGYRCAAQNWQSILKEIDRKAECSIRLAYLRMSAARSVNERDFYRLDYVEQKVVYLTAMARHIIGLLDEQLQLAINMRKAKQAYVRLLASEVLPNLEGLVLMVTEENGYAAMDDLQARNNLQEMALNSLAVPPPLVGAAYENRSSSMFQRLYRGLEDLHGEGRYLREMIGKI